MPDDQHMSTMTPPSEAAVAPMRTKPVPGWVAVVSIVLGILGMLCWGQQGISWLLMDVSQLEAQELDLSSGHRVLALVGYVVNLALAITLLVGGLRANGGAQLAAAGLLRCWAWLKLLAVAAGLVVAWVFFDELVQMYRLMVEEAARESGGAMDEFGDDLLVRMSVALLVVSAAIQMIWPCVVLSVVPRASVLQERAMT